MASVLSSFFTRDPKSLFAYDIPQSANSIVDGVSTATTFKKAEPDELASIFWSGQDSTLKAQAQKLKTMRHPNIITYLDSIEVDSIFYLVTEKCKPLSVYLSEMQFNGSQKEFVVSWGLFQVMSGLKFLHEAKLSHENIRRSIYVTTGGDWKIAGLNFVTVFSSARTDLNQLAILLWEVFNGFKENITKPEASGKMPHRLLELYKAMAAPSAARLTVTELIKEYRTTGSFFKNKFVDTLLFLEEFQLKEANEKQSFFMHLRENLDIFPDDLAKYKILPKLILAYEYGDAGPNILIPLFKLGRLLDEEEYQRKIVPCLVKLFGSPDRTTRVKLLERIDEFGPHLSAQVINDKIFTNIASGFLDTSPAVRESTVKAMVSLAEKLNFHNLNIELMKYLARLQGSDEHGGIRTNTTICLGKISGFLDPSKRQGILLSAFTRGMKDPFPPARMAAVLALSATQQYYSLAEIAKRVLPALSPLVYDPEKQVRDQTFKAIKGFLEKTEKASENPELIPELESQVKAGGRSLLSSDKVPQWASWALKSLSGKFYKGNTPENRSAQEGQDGTVNELPSRPDAEEKPYTQTFAVQGKHDDDNWGDVNSESTEVDGNEWSTAAKSKDDDDWSNSWENNSELPTKKASTGLSTNMGMKKSATGGLKLSSLKQKTETEDPVDALLGLNTMSILPSIKKPSSTGITSVNSGWDDFATEDNIGGSALGGGWDNDEWEANSSILTTQTVTKPTSSPVTKSKEERRAELAARNAARKKELATKRARAANKQEVARVVEKIDGFDEW